MVDRAKHAFGSSQNLEAAKQANKIDAFDILFLDGDTEPKVGWLDAQGNTVIIDHRADLSKLESELEAEIATKVSADDVDTKINTAVTEKVESAMSELTFDVEVGKDYEISHKPDGTLVDYRDKEIRVMCPSDTQWTLQNSGEGADKSAYYIGFKAYAPSDDVASFKEDLAEIISDDEMYYFEGNDFAGIDADGKKYSIVWLPVAKYDEATGTWAYYGASSTVDHYIGWYYSVNWYNTEGKIVATDCIRINLSNENCHSSIKPSYVNDVMKKVETMVEEKIEEATTYEIVEF